MIFAGIWETWKGADGEVVESCKMLQRFNRLVEPLRDRMSIILRLGMLDVIDRQASNSAALARFYRSYPVSIMDRQSTDL